MPAVTKADAASPPARSNHPAHQAAPSAISATAVSVVTAVANRGDGTGDGAPRTPLSARGGAAAAAGRGLVVGGATMRLAIPRISLLPPQERVDILRRRSARARSARAMVQLGDD